ncbi:MAG: double zinc ribbon domain-containing protein, partial [Candidatus Micrarchaeia archaeon]
YPKCSTLNELDAEKCVKCGYDFNAELARANKVYYVCPACGYKMDTIMTQCPACGAKFVYNDNSGGVHRRHDARKSCTSCS